MQTSIPAYLTSLSHLSEHVVSLRCTFRTLIQMCGVSAQARSLPTDNLRPTFLVTSAAIYFIQVFLLNSCLDTQSQICGVLYNSESSVCLWQLVSSVYWYSQDF